MYRIALQTQPGGVQVENLPTLHWCSSRVVSLDVESQRSAVQVAQICPVDYFAWNGNNNRIAGNNDYYFIVMHKVSQLVDPETKNLSPFDCTEVHVYYYSAE